MTIPGFLVCPPGCRGVFSGPDPFRSFAVGAPARHGTTASATAYDWTGPLAGFLASVPQAAPRK